MVGSMRLVLAWDPKYNLPMQVLDLVTRRINLDHGVTPIYLYLALGSLGLPLASPTRLAGCRGFPTCQKGLDFAGLDSELFSGIPGEVPILHVRPPSHVPATSRFGALQQKPAEPRSRFAGFISLIRRTRHTPPQQLREGHYATAPAVAPWWFFCNGGGGACM
jgi:hypothetical protein